MKEAIWLALAAAMATSAVARDNAADAVNPGVIRMAASLNEMALACGHKSAANVEAGRIQQRAAAIKDMAVAPAEYDRMYATYKTEFTQKWKSMPPAQQQQACAQMPRP